MNKENAALFSLLTYAPTDANNVSTPEGWESRVQFDRTFTGEGGFGARVFHNPATGEHAVAFRGTDSFTDWLTNGALALGMYSTQLVQALKLVADLQNDGVDLSQITFVGHSLGGGLASIMGVFFGRPAMTFAVAPFEASARDDVGFDLQYPVNGYYSDYVNYLGTLPNTPLPADGFLEYRNAWLAGFQEGAALFQNREATFHDWYVTDDPVHLASPGGMTISGGSTELVVGDQSVLTGSPARHDMRLVAALVNSFAFQEAHRAHEGLIEQLGNAELYDALKSDAFQTAFLVRLLRAAYSDDPAERSLIDRFAEDLKRFRTNGALSEDIENGLIATAIEYYNYAPTTTAADLFSNTGGALRLDLRRLPSWDPPGAQGPAIADPRGGRGTTELIRALPDNFSFDENARLRLDALNAEVWTVKTEAGGLATSGLADNELQLGSSESSNYLAGAGGDDVLVGGDAADFIDGGSGWDSIFAGDGNDILSGGGGTDYLAAGDDDDILQGGTDADYLAGSSGDDTYLWSLGDGNDVINDEDGNNRLVITGTQAVFDPNGFYAISGTQWESLDHGFRLTQGITWSLTIKESGEVINLGSGGDFGFTLHADLGAPTFVKNGDLSPLVFEFQGVWFYDFDFDDDENNDDNLHTEEAHPWLDFADILHGHDGRDALNGRGGNDAINGGDGADVILGETGDDFLIGNGGADTIYGGDGRDFIFGSTKMQGHIPPNMSTPLFEPPPGNFGINSSGWNWATYFTDESHASVRIGNLSAGPELDSDEGNYIDGGAGNDLIVTGLGDDTAIGGEGRDRIFGQQGNDRISGGTEGDVISGDGARFSTLVEYSPPEEDGNDTLTGDAGNDLVYGQGGDDIIFGDGAKEAATDGDDEIHGDDPVAQTPVQFHGNDWINAGGGDDIVAGGGGDDVILGGTGNDSLRGDDVGVTGMWAGDDKLFGGDGDDHLFGEEGDDLLVGGLGADDLQGGEGADTYIFTTADAIPSGSAVDVIHESPDAANIQNRIVLGEGFTSAELRVKRSTTSGAVFIFNGTGAQEAVIGIENGLYGVIRTVEFEGVERWRTFINRLDESVHIRATGDNGELYGGGADDELNASGNGNTAAGGRGNDVLIGDAGATKYLYDIGDGRDLIQDAVSVNGSNRLVFGEGISLGQLRLSYEGGTHAKLTFSGSSDDSIELGFFDAANVVNGARTINEFEFADGSVATWADLVAQSSIAVVSSFESLSVQGTSVSDSISVGSQDESVFSGAGNDTIFFGRLSGSDIIENDGPVGTDTVRFIGGLTPDLVQTFRNGNDLVVKITDSGNRLLIRDFFTGSSVSELRFENGFVLNSGNVSQTAWPNSPSSGVNDLFGTSADNVINGGFGDDRLSGGAGNDTLNGGGDNDTLRGESGNDTLDGGDGADALDGGAGDDILTPGLGQSVFLGGATAVIGGTVHGGAGNDTLRILGGEGFNTIWRDTEGANILSFGAAIAPASVRVERFGVADVLIYFGSGDERLQMSIESFRAIAEVRFTGGPTLTGLQIGSLFDVSTPASGYIYLNGDLDDVSLHRRDQNLVLAYSGDVQDWVMQSHLDSMGVLYSLVPGSTVGVAATSALVVYNWYDRAQGSYLSSIRDFGSNSSDPESVVDLYSTAWNIGFDLVGTAGADHLVGTAVNDTLAGLGGNDLLEGGAGNDVYRIDGSSAEDTIVDSAGADRIEISGASSTAVEFHDTVAGLEAVIGNPADGNRIVVQGWFTNPENRIESWAFAGDAITLTADQVEARIVGNRAPILVTPIPDSVAAAGTAFTYQLPQETFVDPNPGDTLNYGAALENGQPLPAWMMFDGTTRTLSGTRPATDTALYSVRISATDGSGRTVSDTLTIFARPNQQVGTESADTLNGTAADDVLEGYGGADVLSGADGQDELQGGAGHDRLDGGSGNDLLLGGSGEDRITGSAGDDRLEGGDGADTYLFGAEFGSDTIIDSGGRSRFEFTEASGIEISDLDFSRDADDLVITNGLNSIRVRGWFAFAASELPPETELVTNANGRRSVYDSSQLNGLATGGNWGPNYPATGARPAYIARGQPFTYVLPEDFFSDPLPITLELDSAPAWVSFDPLTRTLSGIAPTDSTWLGIVDLLVSNSAGGGGLFTVRLQISDLVENLDGTSGADVLTGQSGRANYIQGHDGNDTITLTGDWSYADGGDGDDLIKVGVNSYVYAGAGNDRIENRAGLTSAGQDYRIYGEDGDDIINVAGNARVEGGDGNDTITGSDWVFGGEGDDVITGIDSDNTFAWDDLFGGAGNDTLIARDGNDHLYGDEGNDLLDAGLGNDWMSGDEGNDVFNGGRGNDLMSDFADHPSDDRYVGFSWMTGSDQIDDRNGFDTIEFDPGNSLRIDQLVFARSSDNLLITMPSSSGFQIRIDDWYSGVSPQVIEEFLLTNNGLQYRYTSEQIAARVNGTNLAPEARQAILGQVAAIGSQFSMQVATNTFSDAVSQFTLQYLVTLADGSPLPSWLTFDSGTRTFSGTPVSGDAGVLNVRVTAQDAGGLTGTMDFVIGVGATAINGTASGEYIAGTSSQDFIYGRAGDDYLLGGAGDDYLFGEGGNDNIEGGSGTDMLVGGDGNDVYAVDDSSDIIVELGAGGTDEVRASVSYTLAENVENLRLQGGASLEGTGNSADNLIVGNTGANLLDGAGGNDVLQGGAGDDTYVIRSGSESVLEEAGAGSDTVNSDVSFVISANVENLVLTGTDSIAGTGNDGSNNLTGNDSDNILDGGGGADVMTGGAGWDNYIVDNAADVVVEIAEVDSYDQVDSSVSYTLGAEVEGLILTGEDHINATGNALDNSLGGNTGNNVLDGGAGADIMEGNSGNDTYVIDNAGDSLSEDFNGGNDTIQTYIQLGTLASNFENLTLLGTADLSATGNSAVNILTGNSGNNALNGGTGADQLRGGLGDDTYTVDNINDVVTENAGEGTDSVTANINNYTLAVNVENLTVGGSNVTATGNALDNLITGNSAANTLNGGAGSDTINGGTGNDTMNGGLGDDAFIVNASGDIIQEAAGEGTDTIRTTATLTSLAANVENVTIETSAGAINVVGNTLNNVLTGNGQNNTMSGNDGSDTLYGNAGVDTLNGNNGDDIMDGGAGSDTMNGGAGNDTFVVDATGDVVTEASGGGTDTIQTSVTLSTWAANVENMTLTGSNNINAPTTTSSLNNAIVGNAGNNSLNGGSGDDTLNGMGGTDALTGGLGADTYQYTSGGGADTIDNVAVDSLIDRLVFTDLASTQITFSRAGNNLIMTRVGVATDQVTVTNWFSATANRLDFVNFTNRQVTAAEVDTLVNGGGGSFPLSVGRPVLETFAQWGTKRSMLLADVRGAPEPEDPAYPDQLQDILGTEYLKTMTLGGKSSLEDILHPRLVPIKNFVRHDAEVGLGRLINAMSTFGAEAMTVTCAASNESIVGGALEQLAAGQELSRSNHAFRNEWRALAE